MKSLNNTINNHLTDFNNTPLVNYENLPNMDLYMEQLMQFLAAALRQKNISAFDQVLTPAMINNYVKDEVILRPNGKKYGKDNIATIIEAALLKDVLDIDQVKLLINNQQNINFDYNQFVEKYMKNKKTSVQKLKKDLKDVEENNVSQIYDLVLNLAINNVVNNILMNHLLDICKIYNDTNN